MYVCTSMYVLLKIGVPRCVTKCDRGRGVSKLVQKNVTYFMDGPYVAQSYRQSCYVAQVLQAKLLYVTCYNPGTRGSGPDAL